MSRSYCCFGIGTLVVVLGVVLAVAAGQQNAAGADYPSSANTGAYAAGDSGVQTAAFRGRRPCPRGWVEVAPGEASGQPAPATPPGAAPPPEEAIPPSALAGGFGAAPGPASATPNMIGDTANGGFGSTRLFAAPGSDISGGTGPDGGFTFPRDGASVGLSGGDRRFFKIADDENPLPADRVFFNYNHFQNPLLDVTGAKHNLERFTFGAEKTFRDGLWSIGLRVPFSADYNGTQSMVGGPLSATEFGNMNLVVKRALVQREHFALSAGLGFGFPTGADWRIVDATRTLVEVWNESVHIDPFLGAIWAPTDRLFFLFFGQMDFDTRGNTVLMAPLAAGPLAVVDRFHDQTLGLADVTLGYRLFQNPNARILTGITPIVELHYTSTLSDMDFVTGTQGSLGATAAGGAGRRDILNCTGGVHLELGPLSTLTLAGVAPLKTGENREFDSEFIVQFDRRF